MTAAAKTQKKFQRIDVADLERLLQIEAQEEPVSNKFFGFIKSMLDKYIF